MIVRRLGIILLMLVLIVGLEVAFMVRYTVSGEPAPTPEPTATPVPTPEIDLEKVKPNEAGEIPIIMFHAFIEELDPERDYDSMYLKCTQSFSYLRHLMEDLYDRGYRLTSMNDFLNNDIKVEAGCKPVIFTFDDGTNGQFSLTEQDGKLVVNPDCAVAVMLDFYEEHPDFGLEGTFYINLATDPFYDPNATGHKQAGTLAERLQYLVDLGFELGNHTYDHYSMPDAPDAETVIREVGKNQAKLSELLGDYTFTSFSLPYGNIPSYLFDYIKSGVYDGVPYENKGVVLASWDPSVSPVNPNYDPYSIHRVRGTGFMAEQGDFEWWLENERPPVYVSDGDPDTITVPEEYQSLVDEGKLGDKHLRIY